MLSFHDGTTPTHENRFEKKKYTLTAAQSHTLLFTNIACSFRVRGKDLVKQLYSVFKMDWGHFKELLQLSFLCQTCLPIILMVEKCVHYLDIWNKKRFSKISRCSFFKFSAKPKYEKVKFIPNIKMYTFFHHMNDGGKCLAPKMKPRYVAL